MLEAINYVRNKITKKMTVDKTVTHLKNGDASNWNKESVDANFKEM